MTDHVLQVERSQVLAHRVAAQGLHRWARSVDELAVLDLGVQEAMGYPAALAFTARLTSTPTVPIGPDDDYALAWSVRGAPHVHRRAELGTLAGALWPLSEADAGARVNESGPAIKKSGIPALEQFSTAVETMRAVVTSATDKGAASTAVTERLPTAMRRECRTCGTSHISDQAMRVASLPAGLELDTSTAPPILMRRKGSRVPKRTDTAALTVLARSYLEVLGPATPADFANYRGARRRDVAEHWPDDLVEVSVGGRRAWVPADGVDTLASPPDPDIVRLLGPFDPYLQARDRELIVADKAVRKVLWPMIGRPGALLVDGEVVGAWRPKTSGSKLTITVEAFAPLSKAVWTQIDTEAERVAEARRASEVAVRRKP